MKLSMRHTRQTTSGYSLLELLVYIALFIVISVVLLRSLVVVMRTYASAERYRQLQTNGELVMERIVREIRASEGAASGVFGSNPGTLTLTETVSGVSKAVTFTATDGVVTITDGASTSELSTDQVVVNTLVFQNNTTPHSTGVRTELTLTTTRAPFVTATFYSTTVVRNQ